MSDWNTLHFFNDKLFYSEVVPDFKGEGTLLKQYFNSQLGKCISDELSRAEESVEGILGFCKFLEADFKSHKTLYEIQSRQKKVTEEYSGFFQKQSEDEKEFFKNNGSVIDVFSTIFPLIVFSECAAFNPHLILGRKIFTGHVQAKPKSIADEVISMVTKNTIHSSYLTGIINWITNEDLKLLLMDRDNLFPSGNESERYFSEFIKFIEIAVDNNLGVISGTNMVERVLKLIENPKVKVKIDLEYYGFKSVINCE